MLQARTDCWSVLPWTLIFSLQNKCQVCLFRQARTKSKFTFSKFSFFSSLHSKPTINFFSAPEFCIDCSSLCCTSLPANQYTVTVASANLTLLGPIYHSRAHKEHIGQQWKCVLVRQPWRWVPPGAALVTSDRRYVTKWLPRGVCHDMMNAFGSPAFDSSWAIFFSRLLVLGYDLSWRRRENPGGEPAGDPRCEISTVRSQRRAALASPPCRSVPRAILYLQQD